MPATPRRNHRQFIEVPFSLDAPQARQVVVAGDFNGWSSSQTPLCRQADGRWETTVALPPGQYQYRFVVDGQWIDDPEAKDYMPNQYGSVNCVIHVRG